MLFKEGFPRFQVIFKNKLEQMLNADELGAWILVLANSMQDSQLHDSLIPALKKKFSRLRELHGSGKLEGAPDDMAVFEALLKTGIDQFGTWESRSLDPWQVAFNPLRALRPARGANERFDSLRLPFDPERFHFNKPFLKPETLSEEVLDGAPLRIMYHKFPFAPYHLLLVPEAEKNHPQFIDNETHRLLWTLTGAAAEHLPGIGIGANSLGAGASINHLHAHSFIEATPLPIELPRWRHNGGETDYPLACRKYTSLDASCEKLEQLNHDNQPFNLLYRPGYCYIIPRKPQGLEKIPQWLRSGGWFEVCGAFNLADRQRFDDLEALEVAQGLAALNIQGVF